MSTCAAAPRSCWEAKRRGLSDVWRGAKVTAVRLPMHGLADSLNVSTTAAILFYEALRQRGGSS
jgi:TrmH family RNA methyltransferase